VARLALTLPRGFGEIDERTSRTAELAIALGSPSVLTLVPEATWRYVMEKRLVTRYSTKSAAAADENETRIRAVFEELNSVKPDNVSYLVLRLADDSFVHVSFHDHSEDEINPIASTIAFGHFQQDFADRRNGDINQQTASLVGAYITKIE
jgi:hypothetical protein